LVEVDAATKGTMAARSELADALNLASSSKQELTTQRAVVKEKTVEWSKHAKLAAQLAQKASKAVTRANDEALIVSGSGAAQMAADEAFRVRATSTAQHDSEAAAQALGAANAAKDEVQQAALLVAQQEATAQSRDRVVAHANDVVLALEEEVRKLQVAHASAAAAVQQVDRELQPFVHEHTKAHHELEEAMTAGAEAKGEVVALMAAARQVAAMEALSTEAADGNATLDSLDRMLAHAQKALNEASELQTTDPVAKMQELIEKELAANASVTQVASATANVMRASLEQDEAEEALQFARRRMLKHKLAEKDADASLQKSSTAEPKLDTQSAQERELRDATSELEKAELAEKSAARSLAENEVEQAKQVLYEKRQAMRDADLAKKGAEQEQAIIEEQGKAIRKELAARVFDEARTTVEALEESVDVPSAKRAAPGSDADRMSEQAKIDDSDEEAAWRFQQMLARLRSVNNRDGDAKLAAAKTEEAYRHARAVVEVIEQQVEREHQANTTKAHREEFNAYAEAGRAVVEATKRTLDEMLVYDTMLLDGKAPAEDAQIAKALGELDNGTSADPEVRSGSELEQMRTWEATARESVGKSIMSERQALDQLSRNANSMTGVASMEGLSLALDTQQASLQELQELLDVESVRRKRTRLIARSGNTSDESAVALADMQETELAALQEAQLLVVQAERDQQTAMSALTAARDAQQHRDRMLAKQEADERDSTLALHMQHPDMPLESLDDPATQQMENSIAANATARAADAADTGKEQAGLADEIVTNSTIVVDQQADCEGTDCTLGDGPQLSWAAALGRVRKQQGLSALQPTERPQLLTKASGEPPLSDGALRPGTVNTTATETVDTANLTTSVNTNEHTDAQKMAKATGNAVEMSTGAIALVVTPVITMLMFCTIVLAHRAWQESKKLKNSEAGAAAADKK